VVSRPRRVLNAADVAEILGRDRRWTYAHAEDSAPSAMATGRRDVSGSTST
jgi:hypothetical protein